MISLNGGAKVYISYLTDGARVEAWVTDGMPNLTAADPGVKYYCKGLTEAPQ
jgi:hypothetical protein